MDFVAGNSHALGLMRQGRREEAIVVLHRALSQLRERPSTSDSPAETQAAGGSSNENCPPHVQSVPVLCQEDDNAKALLNSADNLFNLFPSAFVLSEQPRGAFCESTFMVVLLYNLGLAYHLQALERRDWAPCTMGKILKSYELALNAAHVGWPPREYDLHKSILLAITNNLGHVHSILHNFVHARECLFLMLGLMRNGDGPGPVPLQDYQVFFDSVYIYWHGTPLANCPAA